MVVQSREMMVGGGVVTASGGFIFLLGASGTLSGPTRDGGAPMVAGAAIAAIGLPLFILGMQRVPESESWTLSAANGPRRAASAAPRVRVSPTAADATWSF